MANLLVADAKKNVDATVHNKPHAITGLAFCGQR